MPFSFIDIEERKTRVIGVLLCVVIAFYFVTAYLIVLVVRNSVFSDPMRGFALPTGAETLTAFGIALLVGLIHWSTSTGNMINRLSVTVGAADLDPKDTYHQMFRNVVDEVSVAIGGRPIRAMIIPTVACNAFALEDFAGRAVIGVTEGLLTRLDRAQLEAVVGHEAGHIINGDCLTTSVTCSLAELYEEVLNKINKGFRQARGRGGLLLLLLMLVMGTMKFLSALLRYFISRQKEYRADATSVRLTRDPLSLAEALYLISRNWRGMGAEGERMESIFIMSPGVGAFDEKEGVLADLFSTHPPIAARIRVLTDMAHTDSKTLEENMKNFHWVSPVAKPIVRAGEEGKAEDADKKWMVFNGAQKWQGPYGLEELGRLAFLTPDSWVCPQGEQGVRHAYESAALMPLFGGEARPEEGAHPCPHCRAGLTDINYEGVPALRCAYCEGIFVADAGVSRILFRRDMTFSEDVVRLAEAAVKQKDLFQQGRIRAKHENPFILTCPQCGNKMRRQFFVYSYPVEIDRCISCGGLWFDKTELEVLQYIYEHKDKFFDGEGF
ncbi:MAG: M48 family metalloprotease [Deltaproteobacteria bacterium]